MKRVQIRQKGERRISAALRIMFVVLLLAVQVAVVVLISHALRQYVAIGYAALQIISVLLPSISTMNRVSFLISSSGSFCFYWRR